MSGKVKSGERKDDGHQMKVAVHFTDADAERLDFAKSIASSAYVAGDWRTAGCRSWQLSAAYGAGWCLHLAGVAAAG